MVGVIRGAGGLCVATAAGTVLLLLLALLLLPKLSAAGGLTHLQCWRCLAVHSGEGRHMDSFSDSFPKTTIAICSTTHCWLGNMPTLMAPFQA